MRLSRFWRAACCALTGLLVAVTPVAALENAFRYKTTANRGAYASIVTGNPTLRGQIWGAWSFMRVAVRCNGCSGYAFGEIGWLKGTQSESNQTPRAYWTYRSTGGYQANGWGGYPGIGYGYNYKVQRSGSGTWNFYFNDLNNPLVTRSLGFDNGDDMLSGGETNNGSQGMGDSYNNNVQYLNTSETAWYGACGGSNYITSSSYRVDDGSNCSSWRVYGNN